MYYSKEFIDQLKNEYADINNEYDRIINKYLQINFSKEESYEFFRHGFIRRLNTLNQCIINTFKIYPADRTQILSEEERTNLEINLQTFIFNTFGCLDNLAWVWNYEAELNLKSNQIGILGKGNKKHPYRYTSIRESFSKEFNSFLDTREEWFNNYQKNFRNALAHRIPLYVPPYILSKDNKTKMLVPYITHSFSENSEPIVFHPQIISDWRTIIEISEKFIEELKRLN